VRDRAEGVIRVPKTQQESPFSSNDKTMLMSIATRLGRLIEDADSFILGKFFDLPSESTVKSDSTRPRGRRAAARGNAAC